MVQAQLMDYSAKLCRFLDAIPCLWTTFFTVVFRLRKLRLIQTSLE